MKLPQCPRCNAAVDLKPTLDQIGITGVIPKGYGVRCPGCGNTLKFSQWRVLALRFLPFLVLVPFAWYPNSPMALRIIAVIIALGPGIASYIRPPYNLFEPSVAEPFENLEVIDDL